MDKTMGSRVSTHKSDATLGGHAAGAADGGSEGDGEMGGVGSSYRATLNERKNKSMNRNAGPDRPSANKGTLPLVSQGQRKSGKI